MKAEENGSFWGRSFHRTTKSLWGVNMNAIRMPTNIKITRTLISSSSHLKKISCNVQYGKKNIDCELANSEFLDFLYFRSQMKYSTFDRRSIWLAWSRLCWLGCEYAYMYTWQCQQSLLITHCKRSALDFAGKPDMGSLYVQHQHFW